MPYTAIVYAPTTFRPRVRPVLAFRACPKTWRRRFAACAPRRLIEALTECSTLGRCGRSGATRAILCDPSCPTPSGSPPAPASPPLPATSEPRCSAMKDTAAQSSDHSSAGTSRQAGNPRHVLQQPPADPCRFPRARHRGSSLCGCPPTPASTPHASTPPGRHRLKTSRSVLLPADGRCDRSGIAHPTACSDLRFQGGEAPPTAHPHALPRHHPITSTRSQRSARYSP